MTTEKPTEAPSAFWLRRFVNVEPAETMALLASFAMFFTLLSAYYIIRPVRDEIGVSLGKDTLHQLFSIVFVVMLVLVPLFGFVAARFPRRLVLPAIYMFFALNLIGFWITMKVSADSRFAAGTFFVWASVFNLFVVSLFWSLMSELWSHAEASRLYGFISAGGTAGALAGPLLTQGLVRALEPVDLLPFSAALLLVSMMAGIGVRRLRPGREGAETDLAVGGIFDGAIKVFTTPMFLYIALFVFLANVVGTFFYLEQARLVAVTIPDSMTRVQFFAGRDLAVSIATLLIEVFGTARVFQRFGLTAALLALPLTAAVGTLLLSFDAVLWIVAAVMVAERVVAFALANPAVKVIYTLAEPDEKYKVQNFIDTVVYRGGDASSSWVYGGIGGGLGFASGAVAIPLVVLWLWVAKNLGREHQRRTGLPS